jgi:hypothetical protein
VNDPAARPMPPSSLHERLRCLARFGASLITLRGRATRRAKAQIYRDVSAAQSGSGSYQSMRPSAHGYHQASAQIGRKAERSGGDRIRRAYKGFARRADIVRRQRRPPPVIGQGDDVRCISGRLCGGIRRLECADHTMHERVKRLGERMAGRWTHCGGERDAARTRRAWQWRREFVLRMAQHGFQLRDCVAHVVLAVAQRDAATTRR